jgi:hypothetical protein
MKQPLTPVFSHKDIEGNFTHFGNSKSENATTGKILYKYIR